MDFEKLKKDIIEILRRGLDDYLVYHSLDHTLDVLDAVIRLGEMEGVNGHELTILKTAALFHDAGFINKYEGHEEESALMVREMLPQYGYSSADVDAICDMIMATQVPQQPGNLLEKILADADLDYLGRDDLFLISQRLHYELRKLNKVSSLREWHEKQLDFLKEHSYFTSSAQKLRKKGKKDNIRELENLLCRKN